MSKPTTRGLWISKEIFLQSSVDLTSKALWSLLQFSCNTKENSCQLTNEHLAATLQISPRSVQGKLHKLKKNNFISSISHDGHHRIIKTLPLPALSKSMDAPSGFKGIWVKQEILSYPNLDLTSKLLWSQISILGELEHGACYASNAFLGKSLLISERAVRNRLIKLKAFGLIEEIDLPQYRRVLKVRPPLPREAPRHLGVVDPPPPDPSPPGMHYESQWGTAIQLGSDPAGSGWHIPGWDVCKNGSLPEPRKLGFFLWEPRNFGSSHYPICVPPRIPYQPRKNGSHETPVSEEEPRKFGSKPPEPRKNESFLHEARKNESEPRKFGSVNHANPGRNHANSGQAPKHVPYIQDINIYNLPYTTPSTPPVASAPQAAPAAHAAPYTSDDMLITQLLIAKIREIKPNVHIPQNITPWCRQIALMRTVEGRSHERMRNVIDWLNDPDCRFVVLSAISFRKKFDYLEQRMEVPLHSFFEKSRAPRDEKGRRIKGLVYTF